MVLVGSCTLFFLYGYQGADSDPEQLALTDQLFDAAFDEMSVVARGQLCLLVGDFNVEPTKIPCLAKGISAGLWVDFEEARALGAGLQPAPTCKRDWSSGGHRRETLFFLARSSLAGGLLPTLRFVLSLTAAGGPVVLLSLCSALLFGRPLGCLLLIRVGVPSWLRFRGSGRFMMSVFS